MTMGTGVITMGIRTIATGNKGSYCTEGSEVSYNAMENCKYNIRGNQTKSKQRPKCK